MNNGAEGKNFLHHSIEHLLFPFFLYQIDNRLRSEDCQQFNPFQSKRSNM